MSLPARFVAIALCLGVCASSALARRARPAPRGATATAAKAKAKAHFKQGRAYQEAGAYGEAIKEYERAYALAPLAALLYNIGQCHRLGGDKAKAIAAYQRYLSRTSEGTLADEARAHVATLKLKFQVEASEAARRKAQDEADAARRRARELEKGQSQAGTEALRRLRQEQAEQAARAQRAERQKREAAMAAARKRMAVQEEYRRRVKALAPRGRALRAVGITLQVVGSLALAGIGLAGYVLGSSTRRLIAWNERDGHRWYWFLDEEHETAREARDAMIGLGVAGGVVLVTGIVLHVLGRRQLRRAVEAVPRPITVVPLMGPGGPGLVLEGRF